MQAGGAGARGRGGAGAQGAGKQRVQRCCGDEGQPAAGSRASPAGRRRVGAGRRGPERAGEGRSGAELPGTPHSVSLAACACSNTYVKSVVARVVRSLRQAGAAGDPALTGRCCTADEWRHYRTHQLLTAGYIWACHYLPLTESP
ncbi:unnamed protein product [Chrysodeixis includens]|uniref:Uncharacterized protein n=1 Tax=Chrysodeixis includens TaxID=689277 RepID=A0A9N8PZ98_CHRIL|nr:unnamed protein product [Chrysodeixis includens]